MSPFEKKVAFITGASSGIGSAVAVELARLGAKVALAARREDRLAEILERVRSAGAEGIVSPCDVTVPEQVEEAVARTVKEFGAIDLVLANAGFGIAGAFEKLTTEDFRRQFETNFFGVLHTINATLPHLADSKGRLGIVASVAGRVASPGIGAYNASKFALCGLAETLYYELGKKGISVTLINPGFVASEIRFKDNQETLHPEWEDTVPEWFVTPTDKAARQIVKALYKRKPEAIITTHGKLIVGLSRHFPRLLRALVRKFMGV